MWGISQNQNIKTLIFIEENSKDIMLILSRIFILNVIEGPKVVNVSKRPQVKLKKHSWKFLSKDSVGAFSGTPFGVSPIEDIYAYIHGKIEENSYIELSALWSRKLEESYDIIKLEYKTLAKFFLDVVKVSTI